MMKITGKVIHGSGDGRKIGFPTANISPTQKIENLEIGVYASYLILDDKNYPSVTHYGPRTVFDEIENKLETYIFDFDRDIYDCEVEIELIEFVRGTVNFSSLESLKEQIRKDCEDAKAILKNFS